MKIIFFALLAITLAFAQTAQEYRSYDGSGNNLLNPTYGMTNTAKLRKINKYQDGISIPYGGEPSTLPSPRLISNLISNRNIPHYLAAKTTNALTFFGQFTDHDMALTNFPHTYQASCDHFPIPVPTGDQFFDPKSEGGVIMDFCKSDFIAGTGTNTSNPRQFPNSDTGYLDLSQVYGNCQRDAYSLRAFQGGLLKTTSGPDGELPPFNIDINGDVLIPGIANEGVLPLTQLYAAGDVRINENAILTCYHTLFIREHNRIARTLPQNWTDEQIYQTARKWNIAQFQHIVIDEVLPIFLGVPFPAYTGYNSSVNPQADLTFTTAFWRFGHDMLSTIVERLDVNGRIIDIGNLLLRDAFFVPQVVTSVGIGPYLRGAVTNFQQKVDALVVEDVRSFVYSQGNVTSDLVARNIQRAREFGLGSFNDARESLGLPRCQSYSCITTEVQACAALQAAYGPNGIDLVDIFPGILLETKRPNSLFVGDTLFAGIVEQFTRFRAGDRFWYENPGWFTPAEIQQIKSTTFGDIIARNTDSINIPKNVFCKPDLEAVEILNPPAPAPAPVPAPQQGGKHHHHDDDDDGRKGAVAPQGGYGNAASTVINFFVGKNDK